MTDSAGIQMEVPVTGVRWFNDGCRETSRAYRD